MFSLTWFEINNKWTIALRNFFGMLTNTASTAFRLLFLWKKNERLWISELKLNIIKHFYPAIYVTHANPLRVLIVWRNSPFWVIGGAFEGNRFIEFDFWHIPNASTEKKENFWVEWNGDKVETKLAYLVVCVQLDEISLPLRHVST